MHAASVNPEPGSNSRLKKFYLSYLLYCSLRNCRDLVLVPIQVPYLVLFVRTFVLCTISSLFNFQGSICALVWSAWLLYHRFFKLSRLFFKKISLCAFTTTKTKPHLRVIGGYPQFSRLFTPPDTRFTAKNLRDPQNIFTLTYCNSAFYVLYCKGTPQKQIPIYKRKETDD